MKRTQPFYYIVALAVLFILAGLVIFGFQLFPAAESTGIIIDPQSQDQNETLYDLWFTSTVIYDLSVDHSLSGILFSNDKNTVSLLDRDRRLLWEKLFTTEPRQARLSPCGNYAAVGTSAGRLFFTSVDQQSWWDDEGDPVDLIAFSPNANWVIAARSQPDQDFYHLDLFNQAGELQWSRETGPLEKLYFSSEYLDQANIYYSSLEGEQPVITALNLKGEQIWSHQNQQLIAVSKHGSRLAAVQGNRLTVYDSLGYELWGTTLSFEARTVLFNPQNYNRILVYGSREGALENLFYFDLAEDLLWTKRIADSSLFEFTAEGQHIVTSSWRQYKEDYTQMILLDRDGLELNNWEVAMRVEHLIVSGHPHLIVVCGEDGYIDLIDLKPMFNGDNSEAGQETALYSPVTTGVRAEETMVTLYFVDDKNNLVPVTRSVELTDNPLRAALEELIRGPARGSSLYRTIPDKDVYIEVDFNPENGQLYLDLSPELVNFNGTGQSAGALDSLLLTAGSFAEVKEIFFTMNNEIVEMIGDQSLPEQPISPQRWAEPVYIPIMSGERYYLVVQEGASGEQEETALKDLVEQVVRSSRPLTFVPAGLSLIDVRVTPELVQLDFNNSFKEIFPADVTEKDQQKAALLLDALFLTVFENSRSQRVEILVEGRNWAPPAGYPPTNRFFRQPYFINPE